MQGFRYPLSVDGGSLELEYKYPRLVKNAIVSGLYTKAEERVMRPEYGLEPQEFQSVGNIAEVLASIRASIELALEGYPETTFDLRGSINDSGAIDVVVVYQCQDEPPERVEVTI